MEVEVTTPVVVVPGSSLQYQIVPGSDLWRDIFYDLALMKRGNSIYSDSNRITSNWKETVRAYVPRWVLLTTTEATRQLQREDLFRNCCPKLIQEYCKLDQVYCA